MPPVNWDVFAGLPGSTNDNFEKLCRALIRWHYGQFGVFAARAQQPGVEFHLKLEAACSLGEAGRWFGWQCRWYDLEPGRPLATARRTKIEEALATTARVLPNLTDWVLWTRRPLSANDQEWFYGLPSKLRLHLWTADDVESRLSGEAAILRSTYFGDLVLTPRGLREIRERSVAPVAKRWIPGVHQQTGAERVIDRILGRPSEWAKVAAVGRRIQREVLRIRSSAAGLKQDLAVQIELLCQSGESLSSRLLETASRMSSGDLELLRSNLDDLPPKLNPSFGQLPRKLRAVRHPAVFDVTNIIHTITWSRDFLRYARLSLDARIIVVVANAGVGKTELSAHLTAETADAPAGVLLQGGDLPAGGNLDDVVKSISVGGMPVQSIESLVAAVDAAGQRAQRRLPIFIDGLNEAEDPRDWNRTLSALRVAMNRYSHVAVICTIRPTFVDEAVPSGIPQIPLRGFQENAHEAIRHYFRFFKINAADAIIPVGLLRHPLTLRLFCEVTNPKRETWVGVEKMPATLTALFDAYLHQAAKRIAQLAPRAYRYLVPDVEQALHVIGISLWEKNARSLDLAEVRHLLGDSGRPWSGSLVHALEQDGVLIRVRGHTSSNHIAVVYDLLAGHIVGDACIGQRGRDGTKDWFATPETLQQFLAGSPTRHPLAEDVFAGIAGLLPRRLPGQQLWPLVPNALQTRALVAASQLEGRYLDAETVEQLGQLIAHGGPEARGLFARLAETRGSEYHPLNAEFLDSVLRSMTVANRDLIWTEWVRVNAEEIEKSLRASVRAWRQSEARNARDVLTAHWIMWTLTSTVRDLRDEATRALYWFGRGDATHLFSLSLSALQINDPYVGERMLAAAYGVVMATRVEDRASFETELEFFLRNLESALCGDQATAPTDHWLTHEFALGIALFAQTAYPATMTTRLIHDHSSFASGSIPVGPLDTNGRSEVSETLHMDFHNYTLGRLVADRNNYDMSHRGHLAVVKHVEDTVWDLGWREVRFRDVENRLVDRGAGRQRRNVERYGKKYGLVGFFTAAGRMAKVGSLPDRGHRLSDVDLDPSFPEPPARLNFDLPTWVRSENIGEREWIDRDDVQIPHGFLRAEQIDGHVGPWLAVYARLHASHRSRSVFASLHALVLPIEEEGKAAKKLSSGGRWDSNSGTDIPGDYYTFAGEIPWHPEFSTDYDPDTGSPYTGEFVLPGGSRVAAMSVAHRYSWESYHSILNHAGGAVVPSRPFSDRFNLCALPQTFHQVLPSGSGAALSFAAPEGFDGEVLYVKEELLVEFVGTSGVIWLMTGDRHLSNYSNDAPEWFRDSLRGRKNEWRRVWRRADLLPPPTRKNRNVRRKR